MPGAGGNKAMNYLYNVTSRNGTAVGVPLQDLVFNARVGIKAVKYDASKVRYLGGVDSTRTTVTVMKTLGVTTLDGAKRKEVLMAASGRGGQTYIIPILLNQMLGTKFRVVKGYRGLGLMHLAMDKGEVHGRAASWSSITSTKPEWVSKGLVANLVTIGLEREPDLPNVPTLAELVKSDADRNLVRFLAGSAALGRAWAGFGAIPKTASPHCGQPIPRRWPIPRSRRMPQSAACPSVLLPGRRNKSWSRKSWPRPMAPSPRSGRSLA